MKHILSSMLLFSLFFSQTKWAIDKSHSSIGFTITHMLVSEVYGDFKEYSSEIETDGNNFENAKISFSIKAESINTANDYRDKDLKGESFFDTEKFKEITFVSNSMKKISDNDYELIGYFQMKDVKKEIKLKAKLIGLLDLEDKSRAGFKITGELDRFDYNLTWNKMVESVGLVASKLVNIEIRLELKRAK